MCSLRSRDAVVFCLAVLYAFVVQMSVRERENGKIRDRCRTAVRHPYVATLNARLFLTPGNAIGTLGQLSYYSKHQF
jgi:hypothetical protein